MSDKDESKTPRATPTPTPPSEPRRAPARESDGTAADLLEWERLNPSSPPGGPSPTPPPSRTGGHR
jgi:hypothetical protein